MTRLVVAGNGILTGEVRALDQFRGLNLLQSPPFFSQIHCFLSEGMSFSGIFTSAPAQIIGKAPDQILLLPGPAEWKDKAPDNLATLDSLLDLVATKTRSMTWLAGLPPHFFPEPGQAAECRVFNEAMRKRCGVGRIRYLDFPGRCDEIIARMESGAAEVLPLHHPGSQLSFFGAMVIFDLLLRSVKSVNSV